MLVGVDGASTKGVDTYDSLSGVSGLLMTQLERPVPSTGLPSTVLIIVAALWETPCKFRG